MYFESALLFYAFVLLKINVENIPCALQTSILVILSVFYSRKLFITGSIVAIRNFASHANEYSGALKQFYFAVHPDFFGQHPFEKVSHLSINFFLPFQWCKSQCTEVTLREGTGGWHVPPLLTSWQLNCKTGLHDNLVLLEKCCGPKIFTPGPCKNILQSKSKCHKMCSPCYFWSNCWSLYSYAKCLEKTNINTMVLENCIFMTLWSCGTVKLDLPIFPGISVFCILILLFDCINMFDNCTLC